MKKLFLIFLSSFILSFEYEGTAQHLDFFHFFSIPEFQANDVKQTSDGGYLVVGGYHGANGGDFILVKTDSSGNEQWSYTNNRFDGLDGSNAVFSLEIMDSYYYLAGQIFDLNGSSTYPVRIYVIKMDTLLNKIWEREDTLWGGKGSANKIRITADHKLLLTGGVLENDSGKIYSAKIDTSGQIIWKNNFYFGDGSLGLDILDYNSNYLVSGYYLNVTDTPTFRIDTTASLLLNFDSTGNVNWFNNYPDTINNGISSLLKGIDNSIYCGQYYAPRYSNPNNPNSAILHFDTSGSIIFRKEFSNADAWYVGIVKRPNGGFLIAHDFSDILFLDQQCDSTSSLHLSPGYPFKSIIIDSNYKGVIVGNYQVQAGHPYFSYLIRVADTAFTNILENHSPEIGINIFPNPSDGKLTVTLEQVNCEIKAIEIISTSGKIIYSIKNEHGFSKIIDLTYLDNGFYFLRFLLLDMQIPILKKIVIVK